MLSDELSEAKSKFPTANDTYILMEKNNFNTQRLKFENLIIKLCFFNEHLNCVS